MQHRTLLIGSLFLTAGLVLGGPAVAAEKKTAGAGAGKGIPVDSLPLAVQATVKEQTRGAVIRNISKEMAEGRTVYEIETKVRGHSRDMIVGTDGKLMIVETQVVVDSLPAPARATFMKNVGKGKIVLLESVVLGDSLAYFEAQVETNGKRSELKVDPSGRVVTDKKK